MQLGGKRGGGDVEDRRERECRLHGIRDLEIVGNHVVCRHRHGQGCAVAGVETTSQRGQRHGDGGLPPCRRLVGAGVQHLDVDESGHQEQHGHHEHEPDEADPALEGDARPGTTGPGDRQPGDIRRRSVWTRSGPGAGRGRAARGGGGLGAGRPYGTRGPDRSRGPDRWLWRALWGPRRRRLRGRATPGTSARAVRVVSGGDAHGGREWRGRCSRRGRGSRRRRHCRRCHRRGRRRHVGSGQRNRQRDIGQLDDRQSHHVQLTRGGGDDPRWCLELGDRQFALAVRALLQREFVLEGGEPHLTVCEERLPHDGGQQGGHHYRDGHDVQQPRLTERGTPPTGAGPCAAGDDAERRPARRRCRGTAGDPAVRRRRRGRWRRHQTLPLSLSLSSSPPSSSPPSSSASVRTMARSRALSARGFEATSDGDGFRAPRNTSA